MSIRLLFTKFKWEIFAFVLFLVCILNFVSFIAAWARDEGTLGTGFFRNLLADMFFIIWQYEISHFMPYKPDPFEYYGILFLNCVFQALLIERLINVIKYRKDIFRGQSKLRPDA